MRAQELFGLTIRDLRKLRGLSQEELATRAGVHRSYLASIETGGRNVGLVNIVQLAKALDVPPGELFVRFERVRR